MEVNYSVKKLCIYIAKTVENYRGSNNEYNMSTYKKIILF